MFCCGSRLLVSSDDLRPLTFLRRFRRCWAAFLLTRAVRASCDECERHLLKLGKMRRYCNATMREIEGDIEKTRSELRHATTRSESSVAAVKLRQLALAERKLRSVTETALLVESLSYNIVRGSLNNQVLAAVHDVSNMSILRQDPEEIRRMMDGLMRQGVASGETRETLGDALDVVYPELEEDVARLTGPDALRAISVPTSEPGEAREPAAPALL
jgi:hypothetical protein